MAFDTTSVSVGAPTKKADYDRLMDNTKYILSSATAFTGNKTFAGTVSITNSTESTSKTTGAFILTGGAGIAKRLNVGGNSYLSGTLSVLGAASLLSTLGVAGITSITNATVSTAYTNGALVVSGGLGLAGAAFLNSTLNVAGVTTIGNTTQLSGGTLEVLGNIIGRSIDANGLGKATYFGLTHYTNAQEPMLLIGGSAQVSSNTLYIGGGSASFNAATRISLFTAADNTTVTGTERMRIASGGNISMGSDAALVHATAGYYLQIKENSSALAYMQFTNDTTGHAVDNGLVIGIGANEAGIIKNFLTGSNITIETTGTGAINFIRDAVTMVSFGAGSLANALVTTATGVTMAGTLGVTGIASLLNATESTSKTTGGTIVTGGLGVAKRLNVGGNTVLSGTLSVEGAATLQTATVQGAATFSSTVSVEGAITYPSRYVDIAKQSGTSTTVLVHENIIELGSWDMDSVGDLAITATRIGMVASSTILGVSIVVLADTLSPRSFPIVKAASGTLSGLEYWWFSTSTVSFHIVRMDGGAFDSVAYNDTSINRGTICVRWN
jgi:hypothetical protein